MNSKEDTGFPHTFLIDGTETKDALIIAESFNSYFTNLGPKLAEKIPHSPKSYYRYVYFIVKLKIIHY